MEWRPVDSLSQRDCLTLLPRRELRFWALDSGIAAERTNGLAEDIANALSLIAPCELDISVSC
eukprot:4864449-Amphidinium_carterae.1